MHTDSNEFLSDQQIPPQQNHSINPDLTSNGDIFSSQYDPSPQKFHYFSDLKKNNQLMCQKVKEINKTLDLELKTISKPTTDRKFIRKNIFVKKEPQIEQLYQKLDKLKKKTNKVNGQKQYLAYVQQRVESLASQLLLLDKDISQKKEAYKALKRKLGHHDNTQSPHRTQKKQQFRIQDSFVLQVNQLKSQINSQRERVRLEQQTFISSNKDKRQKKLNHLQVVQMKPVHELEDQEVESLKQSYEAMGHRIELLKNRKTFLLKELPLKQKRQLLQQLRQKFQQLSKLAINK